jgi:hypothetical protein
VLSFWYDRTIILVRKSEINFCWYATYQIFSPIWYRRYHHTRYFLWYRRSQIFFARYQIVSIFLYKNKLKHFSALRAGTFHFGTFYVYTEAQKMLGLFIYIPLRSRAPRAENFGAFMYTPPRSRAPRSGKFLVFYSGTFQIALLNTVPTDRRFEQNSQTLASVL